MKVLRLLPEPTAALLSQTSDFEKPETILVFDFGGRTFDLSILSVVDHQIMEIGKGGDMWLGGDDIDEILMNLVFDKVSEESNLPPIKDLLEAMPEAQRLKFYAEIREKVEAAKIELSSKETTNIECFGTLQYENKFIDIDLSRDDFNEAIAPILGRLEKKGCRRLLEATMFEPELINRVILVRGSSQIPAIAEQLTKIFDKEKISLHDRPMDCVALGASILAKKIAGQLDRQLEVSHAAAHDYYLKLAEGKRILICEKNTVLPFQTTTDPNFSDKDQLLAAIIS